MVALGTLGAMLPLSARAGLEALTSRQNATIAADTVVIRMTGMIEAPMATELAALWETFGARYGRLLLDLESAGGSLAEAEAVIAVLADIRRRARVDTLVRQGAMCASACIAVFVQGEDRAAGGASLWVFHGACRTRGTNIPALDLTARYIAILRAAGVSDLFLCDLVAKGYVTSPGTLWISGYELFKSYNANVITRLIEAWRPEEPRAPPAGQPLGPH